MAKKDIEFNYTGSSIKIKSNWFDKLDRKRNTYQKITYKGLNIYFQLYKFRLYGQANENTFVTSISLLRKETGYTTEEIFDILKKMKSANVIQMENVSRWDYLLDENGNVKDKDILVITASDTPKTVRKIQKSKDGVVIVDKDGKVKEIDSPATDDDFYITVSFEMLEYYKSKGLNERYYALYCLISRWRFGHRDHKMNMKIENMAKCLDFDKDTIHRMIYQMNRNYLLSSYRKVRKAGGYKFEHYLLVKCDEESLERWLRSEKDNMDKVTKRADRRKDRKKPLNVEEEMEDSGVVDEVDEQEEQEDKSNDSWGEPDPFENVPNENVSPTNFDNEYSDELLEKYFG
ncbi:hypothetical protein [Schinkia azotoformans]|uniref:hypothetical protein n=1 Tax=Schinkia azotoformans TaxID=1454 RepID=UPI002DB99236|nr:hypothetical protein [Schinkia azotoformans]MEC1778421.1 hypothetical protein [Schinkia azotoformans]MED4328334.1 hypothetical protein [Schinkia azotoformans]